MRQELSLEQAKKLLLSEDVETLPFADLLLNIRSDQQLAKYAPDGVCQIDPRDGTLVIYNSARAKRVHTVKETPPPNNDAAACPICQGESSGIIDLTAQSEGFTFINKNLFPIFHPVEQVPCEPSDYLLHPDPEHKGRASYGFHLLQWTSSIHDRDWHNLPFGDALICLQRLAKLEHKLLYQATDFMAQTRIKQGDQEISGYVSIIKNYGAAAGASLAHDHQQIAYSNILPARFFNNLRFRERNQLSFSRFIQQENPDSLLVHDFGSCVLLVPYFMKRPFDLLLLVKDVDKRYLHQLSKQEQQDLVKGMQLAIRSYMQVMPGMGLEPAYNFIVNNGPGCGLYLEFLPKTQKMGGYEQIGLFVCQARAADCAAQLRELAS